MFAGPTFAFATAHGYIFTDDEDRNNGNSYTVAPNWKPAATAIISEGGNTRMNTARAP